jgi:hypothetical protein
VDDPFDLFVDRLAGISQGLRIGFEFCHSRQSVTDRRLILFEQTREFRGVNHDYSASAGEPSASATAVEWANSYANRPARPPIQLPRRQ